MRNRVLLTLDVTLGLELKETLEELYPNRELESLLLSVYGYCCYYTTILNNFMIYKNNTLFNELNNRLNLSIAEDGLDVRLINYYQKRLYSMLMGSLGLLNKNIFNLIPLTNDQLEIYAVVAEYG